MRSVNETSGSRLTVWYDGACPLCLREIALMRRLDGRVPGGGVRAEEANASEASSGNRR